MCSQLQPCRKSSKCAAPGAERAVSCAGGGGDPRGAQPAALCCVSVSNILGCPAQAEEETRAAHNRQARQSRLARTLEASDAVIARQLQADEERLLLSMLTGAQDPASGFWAAHERPAAPAPSLQVRSHAHPSSPILLMWAGKRAAAWHIRVHN